jgi:hypothetical protein
MSGKVPPIGRGYWRGVYSAMFDHLDFQALSPHARLTLLVCRLGSLNGPASIFRYYREPLMVQTGLTAAELEAALSELEKKPTAAHPWIHRDDSIVWVRNGLKHDPTLSLQHQHHRESILRAISALPYTPTVKKFFRYYGLTRGRGGAMAIPRGVAGGVVGGEGGGVIIEENRKEENRKEKKSETKSAASAARPSRGAPPPQAYNPPDEQCTERRRYHRAHLMAVVGLPYNRADTEAGSIVGAEVMHYHCTGAWPPLPAPTPHGSGQP